MRYIIGFIVMLCGSFAEAQSNYRVVKVEGCIKIAPSTDCLSKDMRLKGDETFNFDSIGSFAVLMGQSGEILSIEPPDTVGFYNGRALDFSFAESIKSSKEPKKMGTTRGEMGLQVTHFNYFFGTSRFTIIGDEARFGVNPLLYPVTKDKFLVVHYKLDNIWVSKRLGFRDQEIRLQKNSLNEFQGKLYNKEKIDDITLYYYEPSTKKTELLVTFDLVFINQEKLYAEFSEIYNQLPNKETIKTEDLEYTFASYFENSYGKTEPQSLQFVLTEFISKLPKTK